MESNLIPADRLLARIEDELSTYSSNGLLDTGKLLTQLKWLSQLFGIAVYEQGNTILKLSDYKAQLPCDFFLLDSAWLCEGATTENHLNFQAKLVVYEETTREVVGNDVNCGLPNPPSSGYLNISACNMDKPVYDKITSREYIYSGSNPVTWLNPVLLSYRKGKSMKSYCSKDCANLFTRFPQEISINMEGNDYYIYSTMKDPVIYVKYYAYPIDEETNIPYVPSEAVLEEAYFAHLVYYFFKQLWTNGDDANLENKVKFWKEESENKLAHALNWAKFPSFNTMVQNAKRVRKKWSSYEIMNTIPYYSYRPRVW